MPLAHSLALFAGGLFAGATFYVSVTAPRPFRIARVTKL
jgi:hypothetical protein